MSPHSSQTSGQTSGPPSGAVLPPLPPVVGFVIAGLLVGAVFLLSMPDELLWQRVVEDAGHGPVFAGIAVILLWMRSPPVGEPLRSFTDYRRSFAIAVALGVVTELLQWSLPNRSVSVADVLHDAAGAALGLSLAWVIERRMARRRGVPAQDSRASVALAIGLAALVVLAWQPLQCARSYAARASAWPTLLPLGAQADAAFSRTHAATLTHAWLPEPYRRPGDGESVRLEFAAGARPGLQLIEPAHDWADKDVLVIDVTNPAREPVDMVLRIFDRTHDWTHADRFNQQLAIPAATRATVRISLETVATSPRGRRMDMAAIADVMLFARRPQDAGELYVTRIWLE